MPRIEPASVMPESPARAMPKSMTLTVPSRSSMTFCGLMSRCTMPLRCANSTAASSCSATAHRLVAAEAAAAADEVLERLALHVLHDDVVRAVDLAPVVDADEVLLVEAGRRLGLAAEALDEGRVVEVALEQHLERDVPAEGEVLAQIDVGHAAAAELAHHAVPAADHLFWLEHVTHVCLPLSFVCHGYDHGRTVPAHQGRAGCASAVLITAAASGAAASPPVDCVSSMTTAMATCGSSAGAKPMNQARLRAVALLRRAGLAGHLDALERGGRAGAGVDDALHHRVELASPSAASSPPATAPAAPSAPPAPSGVTISCT